MYLLQFYIDTVTTAHLERSIYLPANNAAGNKTLNNPNEITLVPIFSFLQNQVPLAGRSPLCRLYLNLDLPVDLDSWFLLDLSRDPTKVLLPRLLSNRQISVEGEDRCRSFQSMV